MLRHDDFRVQSCSAFNGGVEIVDFEPEKNAVAIGLVFGIADSAVMMVDFEVMQLHHQHAIRFEPLVLFAAVSARATQ